MKAIYEYLNYKDYLNDRIQDCPNGGRGVSSRLSKFIGVSAVMVSQVLKGNRSFSRDKIYLTTMFFKLNPLETEYILYLFDLNQSKTLEHVNYLHRRLEMVRSKIVESEKILVQLPDTKVVDEDQSWIASGFEKTYS